MDNKIGDRPETESKINVDIENLFNQHPGLNALFSESDRKYEINPASRQLMSAGHEYFDIPRMRSYIRIADMIRAALPPIPAGHVRLWRGNRRGETGKNPSFTSALEGIALPFFKLYRGQLSYIDVPDETAHKAVLTMAVAENSEYFLPPEFASKANPISEQSLGMTYDILRLCLEYVSWNRKLNKESFKDWLATRTK